MTRTSLTARQVDQDTWHAELPAGCTWVRLGGFRAPYRVLADDAVVTRVDSQFSRVRLDWPGARRLVVHSLPREEALAGTPRRPRQRWRTNLVDDARTRWLRNGLLGHLPGFADERVPDTVPLPLVAGEQPEQITHLALRAGLEPDGTGVLRVRARLGLGLVAGTAVVVLDGPDGVHRAVLDEQGGGTVRVPGVTRWWPHTHGDPVLHAVRVEADGEALPLPGDGTLGAEVTERHVGFRELRNRAPGALAVEVSGVPVFVRGAVWTPGDLVALDAAAGLGLNLVRVPGWARYETDAFHARCDRLGLLVWQDLMLASLDYPVADHGFSEVLRHEAAEVVDRLDAHPSTAVLCGSSETEQQAAMFGVPPDSGTARELPGALRAAAEASRSQSIWVDSSPSGGTLPFRNSEGVTHYFGVGGYRRPLSDVRTTSVRFASECLAFANVPDGGLPEPGSTEWKLGVPRDVGADWDFDDVRDHYLRERYGEVHPADPAWPRLARRVTGELMAATFGEWRREESPCAGGVVLWLRDLLPGAGWGLLDHTGRAKECARLLAPVLAPVAVWITDEGLDGLDVHLAVDTADQVSGGLWVRLLRHDGTVVEEASREVVVPGRGQLRLEVEGVLGHFADVSCAYRFGPPAHDRVEVTWDSSAGVREAAWRRRTLDDDAAH